MIKREDQKKSTEEENVLVLRSNGCIMQKKSCLLSVQHCTAFLPISHTNNTAITLTLRIPKGLD